MSTRLPLSALLSQALVAFTIEFDNDAESQMPHRTTRQTSAAQNAKDFARGPWLTSMVMWFNCLRFVGEQGVRVGELERLARTPTNLDGMVRWGYVTVGPDSSDARAKPRRSDCLILATPAGRKAREIWQPLFGVIEQRWQDRFGENEIWNLRKSLAAFVNSFDRDLPDCLPILGYGLFSSFREPEQSPPPHADADALDLSLPALLAKVLLAFAHEFESDSEVSLAIGANVLRLVGEDGARVRDLPRLSGVSKEAVAVALSYLQKRGYAVVQAESSVSRLKAVAPTPQGRRAARSYFQRVAAIEERWQSQFGSDAVGALRASLERLAGDSTAQGSPLFRGLEPRPGNWRASVPRPEVLPHYPMVLHRGGYPDGS